MKIWFVYTMECHSAPKESEIVKYAGQRMELETIILRDVSKMQKDKLCMSSSLLYEYEFLCFSYV